MQQAILPSASLPWIWGVTFRLADYDCRMFTFKICWRVVLKMGSARKLLILRHFLGISQIDSLLGKKKIEGSWDRHWDQNKSWNLSRSKHFLNMTKIENHGKRLRLADSLGTFIRLTIVWGTIRLEILCWEILKSKMIMQHLDVPISACYNMDFKLTAINGHYIVTNCN